MDLLTLMITLAVIGFVAWLIVTYVPMPGVYKQVFVGIIILLIVVWLVRILVGPLPVVRVR